jgi:hypothetical protein
MCWECDVIEWQNSYRQRSSGAEPCITVPTAAFGYLRKGGGRGQWQIAGARIVRTELPLV